MLFQPLVKLRQTTLSRVSSQRAFRTLVPAAITMAAVAAVASPAQGTLALAPRWPSSTTTVGTPQSVTGDLPAATAGEVVTLQQKVSGGWRTVARTTVDSTGGYDLRVPTWWLGARDYRLQTALGSTSTPWSTRVVPSYKPAGLASQHRFMTTETARWDPCQAIGWRVTNASPAALRDAREAFRQVSMATGFTFRYRGLSGRVPQNDANSWYPADTQIVVAWARKSQSSLFAAHPGADAVGAAVYYGGYRNGDGSPSLKIGKGMVVIDSARRFTAGFGTGTTRGEVLLHEIGHTMGLSHVNASSQRMYPYWTPGTARYGRGDLAALEKRGARLGCLQAGTARMSARTTVGAGGTLVVNQ